MKITLESTSKIVQLRDPVSGHTVQARIWEGETASGIPMIAAITRISIPKDPRYQEEFERELVACRTPSRMAEESFPASGITL